MPTQDLNTHICCLLSSNTKRLILSNTVGFYTSNQSDLSYANAATTGLAHNKANSLISGLYRYKSIKTKRKDAKSHAQNQIHRYFLFSIDARIRYAKLKTKALINVAITEGINHVIFFSNIFF